MIITWKIWKAIIKFNTAHYVKPRTVKGNSTREWTEKFNFASRHIYASLDAAAI